MSLSPLLVETYQRYKRDTNTFVTWLATTAKGVRNVDQLLFGITPNIQHGKGRLKGKERTKAKAHEKPSSAGIVTVPLSSFETLATVVASAGVIMPTHIWQILSGAIAARKECAAFYQGQESAFTNSTRLGLSSDDEGHQYFIRLLEEVKNILAPSAPKVGPKKAPMEEAKASPNSNIFSSLDPGYISDSEEVPSKKSSVRQSPLTPTYELQQPSKDTAEIAFAIFCVLKDMTDVRLFVHGTWREYKKGKVNLVTAAYTMNIAIEIFQRVNAAFLADFPDFDDHEKVDQEFVKVRSFTTREPPAILSSTTEAKHMEKLVSFLLAWSGFFHPEVPVHQQHYDRLLHGICEVQKKRKAYTWVVFALQTFIDMHRELGPEVGRGFEDLKDTFAWLTDIFEDTLELCEREPRFNDERMVKELRKNITHMQDILKESELDDETMDWEGGNLNFRGKGFFYKNHPMLCGWLMQEHLQSLHTLGVQLASWDNNIVSMMHIYNAGQQAGFLKKEMKWADMEYLINRHGEDYVFVVNRQGKQRVQGIRNRDLSPLQTLSIFKDAMKDDEFPIRFDMFTLYKTCHHLFSALQTIILQSPADNPLGKSLFETAEGTPGNSAYFMITMAERPDWRMPILKAWHVVQETIDKTNVVASAPHPAYARSLLSPDQVFGGPNSPEHPGKWNNSTEQDNITHLVAVPYHGGAHNLYIYQARKHYSKRLEQIVKTEASNRAVADLSAAFTFHHAIPPKPAIPYKLEAFIHNPVKEYHSAMLQAFRCSLGREGPEDDDGGGLAVEINV
ncbi:hypothetical protein K491DRAFT_647330 [Lophiostoma macrostomum CBS 122681]|uniref:DUF6604 domain-containing protein n=1 Tax=Lophiostoma macrostomum CBS 122681 TaxID=1314788 RepID=A0A6A6TRG9_9PLEO|nr:hypothetical protein K491DRAFT_647330 [Lophiostoma macrostomum CBS 122681]